MSATHYHHDCRCLSCRRVRSAKVKRLRELGYTCAKEFVVRRPDGAFAASSARSSVAWSAATSKERVRT